MNDTAQLTKSLKVAVTGGAGSGKSTVCRRLGELGAWVISADELARKAVQPGSSGHQRILARFGKSVLNPDGSLNRRKIRQRILSDDGMRKALEVIVHPEILSQMREEITQARHEARPLIVVEVPLLFELDLAHEFDCVVMVAADPAAKIKRLMHRDNVSESAAQSLVNIQLSDELKINQSDIVIYNTQSLKELILAVDDLYVRLSEKLSKSA